MKQRKNEMNYCPQCGAELKSAARFCSSCGTALTGSAEQSFPRHEADGMMVRGAVADARNPTDVRVIGRSKGKLILCFLGSLAFVTASFAMLSDKSGYPRSAVAPLGILFFGASAIACLVMYCSSRPGLKLDSNGFKYTGSSIGLDFVSWSEVTCFREHSIAGSKFLVVFLKDPETFTRRMGLVGALLRLNTSTYGSPIAISSTTLNIGFHDLVVIFARYFGKYGSSRGVPLPSKSLREN